MDKDELITIIQRDFADLLNNSTIKTPEKAKGIADALLQQGVQPTWRLIREVLGTGSATTLQKVVNNYWTDLGKRLNHLEKRADVPDGLAKEFNRLWDKALKQAQTEIETRLKDDFDEAQKVKCESQQQLIKIETTLKQLQEEKTQQEKQWMEEKNTTEIANQQIKQLKKLHQQATAMSQHQQQQATQLATTLDTTKQEYQQTTTQLRTEYQQAIERQAQQYESMIDHYANELGQVKVRQERHDKNQQKERTEWQKQQETITQQSSRLQIDNAILIQENQQLKTIKEELQQQADKQQVMLLTLEKEQSALQTRCLFIEEHNISLTEKLKQNKQSN